MKRLFILIIGITLLTTILGCEYIENQIQNERERIESLSFKAVETNIPDRSIRIKITSDADEQLIEEITINGVRYDLVSEGDDWYLLEDVPIEKAYTISNVYYRTDLGVLIPFAINYDVTILKGLDYVNDEEIHEIEDSLTLGDYTFTMTDDDTLIEVTSTTDFTIDAIDEWIWLIYEDDTPLYIVFEYETITRIVLVPEKAINYLE